MVDVAVCVSVYFLQFVYKKIRFVMIHSSPCVQVICDFEEESSMFLLRKQSQPPMSASETN